MLLLRFLLVLCSLSCTWWVGHATYTLAPVTDDMRSVAQQVLDTALPTTGVTQESSVAWSRLAYICDTFGPRIAGSQALEDALDWIKVTAESDGLRVTEEPTLVPHWVRGEEWAYLLSPRKKKLHMVGLGMSIGTRGENITAEAFVVSGYDDMIANCSKVADKIIVFNTPFTQYGTTVTVRNNAGLWGAECGAVGALVRTIGPFSMQNPHTGHTSNATIPAAAISLEDANQLQRMQNRGQNVVVSLYMESTFNPPSASRNLLIDLVGSELPHEIVLVSGHGDSWDIGEGAMDDGGGFVAAWESIRLLKSLGITPKRTIRAVVWVDEESTGAGAHQYAADYNNSLPETVSLGSLANHSIAIETDSGVFTPRGLGVSCVHDDKGGCNATIAQLQILSELLDDIGGGQIMEGGGGADVEPTCEAGGVVCAGLVVYDQRLSTSGREATSNSENNPCTIDSMNAWDVPVLNDPSLEYNSGYFFYHHSDADTVERIDPYQLNQVSAALAVWTYSIAALPELLPRNDVAVVSDSVEPTGLNVTFIILIALFAVIFGLFVLGGVYFFLKNPKPESKFSILDISNSGEE
jgi:carboxypeptidase Q